MFQLFNAIGFCWNIYTCLISDILSNEWMNEWMNEWCLGCCEEYQLGIEPMTFWLLERRQATRPVLCNIWDFFPYSVISVPLLTH